MVQIQIRVIEVNGNLSITSEVLADKFGSAGEAKIANNLLDSIQTVFEQTCNELKKRGMQPSCEFKD
jgi:hypothetical protein